MKRKISIIAQTAQRSEFWLGEFVKILGKNADYEIFTGRASNAHLVFFDSEMRDLQERIADVDRKGKSFFVIVNESAGIPQAFTEDWVDDVLVYPFRAAEVLSRFRHYEQVVLWDEIHQVNSSMTDLVEQFKEDLSVVERIQKNRLPARFPEVKGFKIKSRYFAGLKSGGDYFDVVQSSDESQVSFVMTDSSSYGLSSAVLSMMMKVTMNLSKNEMRSCAETVKRVYEEVLMPFRETDHLSLFYGVVSKRDFSFRYVNLGFSTGFYCPMGGSFSPLPSQGEALSKKLGRPQIEEAHFTLQPQDRLVILSDGFIEGAGGIDKSCELLNQYKQKDLADYVNEFSFKIKRELQSDEDLPPQDCTALVFEVDSRVIRLMPQRHRETA